MLRSNPTDVLSQVPDNINRGPNYAVIVHPSVVPPGIKSVPIDALDEQQQRGGGSELVNDTVLGVPPPYTLQPPRDNLGAFAQQTASVPPQAVESLSEVTGNDRAGGGRTRVGRVSSIPGALIGACVLGVTMGLGTEMIGFWSGIELILDKPTTFNPSGVAQPNVGVPIIVLTATQVLPGVAVILGMGLGAGSGVVLTKLGTAAVRFVVTSIETSGVR